MSGHKTTFIALIILVAWAALAARGNAAELENWPAFRGENARGLSSSQSLPTSWNLVESENIRWNTSIPGLAHSSPIVWGDRVFVTTAIATTGEAKLKIGLYGDIKPADDDGEHEWKIYALDRNTGDIVWEKTAHRGIPKSRRHTKATHANSTPATDGRHVVALFGSEGMYCYDMNGTQLWKLDLGVLRSSFFMMQSAEWGFASSPVIHDGRIILQCDVQGEAYLATFDVRTGDELWRSARDEIPTWSTPSVYEVNGRKRIVVNGYKHVGGYEFADGREVWNLVGGGDIPVPTPVVANDLIYISSAHGKWSPIYTIRTSASGDITPADDADSNDGIVWSIRRGGSYMQTPLVYDGYLYNCRDNGSLTCFDAKTGERIYREKLGEPGMGFTASAVAGDGKIYYTSEPGDIFVVKAGPDFELLARNSMGDSCMATPAISGDSLFFRTHRYLVAVADGS